MLDGRHDRASGFETGRSYRPPTGSSIEGPVVVGVAPVTAVEGVLVDAWLLGLAIMIDSGNKKTK